MATVMANDNPLAYYGYDSKTGQQLADSLGMTTQELADSLDTTQSTNPSGQRYSTQGANYVRNPTGPGNIPSEAISSAIQQLRLNQTARGSGTGTGSPFSTPGQVNTDAMNAAVNLGAAALGMPAVYNPTPTQAGAKSGVGAVASPTSSDSVPGVSAGPWNTNAGVFANQQQAQGTQNWYQHGGSGSPATAEQALGLAPGTIANKFANAGTAPNYNPAPTAGGIPTPMMPANAAGTQRLATPYATAPPAPGIQIPSPEEHTAGLVNAGKALYSHLGGDPENASHEDISNFHNQLAGMLGTAIGGGQVPGSNYTAGINQPPAALKASAGGYVPGQGTGDTVPALLTPGELVVSRPQLAQIFGGRQPIRMADGGVVPADESSDDSPPEVRRKRLAAIAQSAQSLSNTGSQGSSGGSQAPAAPGGYTGPTAAQIQAQNAAAASQALNSGGASGGGYNIPGGGGYIGASPGVGQSGYMYPNQAAATSAGDVGSGVAGSSGAGSGMPTQQATGVVSGLFSGLKSAMDAYTQSIGNYKSEAQHFSAPAAPAGPSAQLTQQEIDQQKKKQNPMTLAQYGGYDPYQG